MVAYVTVKSHSSSLPSLETMPIYIPLLLTQMETMYPVLQNHVDLEMIIHQ